MVQEEDSSVPHNILLFNYNILYRNMVAPILAPKP